VNADYIKIATKLFHAVPERNWKTAEFVYRQISQYSSITGRYEDDSGEILADVDTGYAINAFGTLREDMAARNENGHAWYTAVVTLTPDGKFKFDFDYDSLPAFDISPSPEDFKEEFQKFPRPELQAQVQDWMDGLLAPFFAKKRFWREFAQDKARRERRVLPR